MATDLNFGKEKTNEINVKVFGSMQVNGNEILPIKVVSTKPSAPDPNTIYIVTVQERYYMKIILNFEEV